MPKTWKSCERGEFLLSQTRAVCLPPCPWHKVNPLLPTIMCSQKILSYSHAHVLFMCGRFALSLPVRAVFEIK